MTLATSLGLRPYLLERSSSMLEFLTDVQLVQTVPSTSVLSRPVRPSSE